MTVLAAIALILAALPAGLFLLNLSAYRRLPSIPKVEDFGDSSRDDEFPPFSTESISVLIPARNEALNIRATLTAVLANRDSEFEVIVLDDHSTDDTVAIVQEFARRDARVRLKSAPPLPAGWCGKQHACHRLARMARNPYLLFMDADVRPSPDALRRLGSFMSRSNAALVSGVPHQELGTFSERLLLPLIHFILLGFLPMHAMRRSLRPNLSAGCGQLFLARREAYAKCGGHAMLRDSLHDGLKLPRVFRQAGFATDLFDATDVFTCRMYRTNRETWSGLGKNASEGLGAPGPIMPMTLLLFGGQVLPFLLFTGWPRLSATGAAITTLACLLSLLPRVLAAVRFQQPVVSAWLHPIGVLALLGIQWHALLRHLRGKPSSWKGRQYQPKSESA